MALTPISVILKDAKKRGYGVPSYNVYNYETMRRIVDVGIKLRQPLIIMMYPGFKKSISFSDFAALARNMAKNADVPVGVHLDHCSIFEEILEAIAAGFPSVMYDGSKLPFEENIRNTKEIVRAAHAMGVDVEGELGIVGSGKNVADFKNPELYTSPEQAKEFVAKTGIDALAVAIGNSHGVYIEKPTLDIDLLVKLDEVTGDVPLVLHGTSGIPSEQVADAVMHGVTKTNIATEMFKLMGTLQKEIIEKEPEAISSPNMVTAYVDKGMREYLTAKFKLLNPRNIAVVK